MPVHTIKLDYDTKKLLQELLKEMRNMNHARQQRPLGARNTPPPIKKRYSS